MEPTTGVEAAAGPVKGKITYQSGGQDVSLSYDIVRNFLTKGTGSVTDQDLVQFISICKYNQLNPFLSEAYLVKFGTQPAQMIVSREALMKRAEACSEYDGLEGGVIVVRDGKVMELEGCFKLDTDTLVGGWAKIYRKDRKYPFVARVNLDEYDKKQSVWNEKKSTMIVKTAKVQALREAFPAQIGAMYTAEERGIQDVPYQDVTEKVASEINENANAETIAMDPVAEPSTGTMAQAVPQAQPTATAGAAAPQPIAGQVKPAGLFK